MKVVHIKAFTGILATITGVIALLLIRIYTEYAITILSSEVLVLPLIYIVSNLYCEKLIEMRKDAIINQIGKDAEQQKRGLVNQYVYSKQLENHIVNMDFQFEQQVKNTKLKNGKKQKKNK